MEFVVSDTNIFLDLFDVGLLDLFFQLPIRVHTVDFVINEIKKVDQHTAIQQLIANGKIIVNAYPSEDLLNLYLFNVECGGNLTLTDSTVIYYAQSLENCRLLTGDRQLRIRAEQKGIIVSGILHVFDQLVENSLLLPGEASKKLEELFKINSRLPKGEVESRIENWKG